jgi:hypothetical protein
VDLRQLVDTGLRAGVHAGDELELRLAEIGRDVRVSQCRAERGRVRRERQAAVGQRAQAFLLHAAAHLAQARIGQIAQALIKTAHAVSPQNLLGRTVTDLAFACRPREQRFRTGRRWTNRPARC